MNENELKQNRDQELYDVYKESLRTNVFPTMRSAAGYVCRQRASSYYIGSERANKWVGRALRHVSLIELCEENRRKIWDIHDRYLEYLRGHRGEAEPRLYVIERIVDSPAPEFFLSPERTRKILGEKIKEAKYKWFG